MRHCSECQRRFFWFDHHCSAVGNCVGARNHRFFIVVSQNYWLTRSPDVPVQGRPEVWKGPWPPMELEGRWPWRWWPGRTLTPYNQMLSLFLTGHEVFHFYENRRLPATTEGRWRRRHSPPGHKAGPSTMLHFYPCVGCLLRVPNPHSLWGALSQLELVRRSRTRGHDSRLFPRAEGPRPRRTYAGRRSGDDHTATERSRGAPSQRPAGSGLEDRVFVGTTRGAVRFNLSVNGVASEVVGCTCGSPRNGCSLHRLAR